MGALFALLRVEGRTASVVTVVLYAVAAVLDASGLAWALFLLVPFTAYLRHGRRAGLAVAAACLAGMVAVLWAPGWLADPEAVGDLLMFAIGLVLACGMAESAARVAELSAAGERNRLARDVHDGLGHHLTAIAVQLEKADAFRDRDPGAADAAVRAARDSAREALDDVRHSVRALRADFDLTAALRALVAQHGAGVTLHVDGTDRGTGQTARTAVYRAAQEALTNARRHAGATAVRVSVAFTDHAVRLDVADDGRGTGGAPEGFGLRGMRERAELAGGGVRVASGPGGTTVTVTVPR
ncbi:sensor histidine kinase [Actinokineospora soli]